MVVALADIPLSDALWRARHASRSGSFDFGANDRRRPIGYTAAP
jgi:hypothetical protein